MTWRVDLAEIVDLDDRKVQAIDARDYHVGDDGSLLVTLDDGRTVLLGSGWWKSVVELRATKVVALVEDRRGVGKQPGLSE